MTRFGRIASGLALLVLAANGALQAQDLPTPSVPPITTLPAPALVPTAPPPLTATPSTLVPATPPPLPSAPPPALAVQPVPVSVDPVLGNPAPIPVIEEPPVYVGVPRVRPMPPMGMYPVLPTGRGYYSIQDWCQGNRRMNPPIYAYPPFGLMQFSFFDADFRYLDSNPDPKDFDWFDHFKQVHRGDWLFNSGGEARLRYQNQYNAQLTQKDNVSLLPRLRVYGDAWYRDDFRIYAEGIATSIYWQDQRPSPYDKDKFDFLNLFADVKLADMGGQPAYVRVGRQEMQFGSQRLVSANDWQNVRQSFQGVRGFRQTECFDFDAFWVQPVKPNPGQMNSVDNNQNFAGMWGTYRPTPQSVVDAYYLMLDNTNTVNQLGLPLGNYTVHTLGSRYAGRHRAFLWDGEAALQFGKQADQQIFAGMATVGLGYHIERLLWNPTFWIYYDYASGDRNPTDGKWNTFNPLFPNRHQYLGWSDLVGRQNIHDLNLHLYMYPTNWLTAWIQYHAFWLASPYDALYNANGTPIRRDPRGRSGSRVGEELDFVLNFHLNRHVDVITGYSYLFGEDFLKNTANSLSAVNSSLAFVQVSYRW